MQVEAELFKRTMQLGGRAIILHQDNTDKLYILYIVMHKREYTLLQSGG